MADRGRVDLAIAAGSLLLAVIAWQRDSSKARRELLDAAVFGSLGILDRYVSVRGR